MILTGERVVPELMKPTNGLLKEHIARYKFASRIAYGNVLDIACGVGYGTSILANTGKKINHIIGVDIDGKSVIYARNKYPHKKITYLNRDALSLCLHEEIGPFDTIVSFETIEHLKHDNLFVYNLKKLLKSNGTLIISTPFGRGRGIPCSNPFHVHQYKEEEFIDLLKCLGNVEMYYQLDTVIEKKVEGKKYYLMVAVCSTNRSEDSQI